MNNYILNLRKERKTILNIIFNKKIFKLSSAMILLYISPLFLIVPFIMIPYFIAYPIWMPVFDWDQEKPIVSGNVPNHEK